MRLAGLLLRLGTDDVFRLTIVISNAPESAMPQFPAMNDFEVLGQPSRSTDSP